MKNIDFSISGTQLSGNMFMPTKPVALNPAILFIHGWTSKQDRYFEYALALSKLGYICMTFDMRGHGISGGDISVLSRGDFLSDVVAAFDLLSSTKGVDKNSITLVGSSFGSYLASILSSERPCKAICLRVPANYPDTGLDQPHYKRANSYYEGHVDGERLKWKTTVHPYTETASLRALHKFNGPILLVESENDEIVPHQVVQSYYNAVTDPSKLKYIVMEDAPHSLSKDEKRQREFLQILTDWLNSQK